MKKLLLVAALVFVAGYGYCDQPQNIGYVKVDAPVGLYSRTLAQMNSLVPGAAGHLIYVSDAVMSRLCVSSGTTAGAWVVATASGTFAGGSYPHCN